MTALRAESRRLHAKRDDLARLLCEVTLLPGRMRQPFDPRLQMRIEWRQ